MDSLYSRGQALFKIERGCMVSIGDVVVYGQEVCTVVGKEKKGPDQEDYYVFCPVDDETMTIYAPKKFAKARTRPIITPEGAEALIDRIPDIETVDVDDRSIEDVYKKLMKSGAPEDLVKVVKTAYLRSEAKHQKGLKKSEKDKTYFRAAEKLLYSELSVVLERTYDDTRDYLMSRVESLAEPA